MNSSIHVCTPNEYQPLENRLSAQSKSTELTEREFEIEFCSAKQALAKALSSHWSSEADEYTIMDEYWLEFHRVLPMAIHGQRTFCTEFFDAIQEVLRLIKEEWIVHIAAEPDDFPEHELDWALLIVTRGKIYVHPSLNEGESSSAYPDILIASLHEREQES